MISNGAIDGMRTSVQEGKSRAFYNRATYT
jgi:hypothetical protein